MKAVDKGIPVLKNLSMRKQDYNKGGGGVCGWTRESSVQKCRTNILYYVLMFKLMKLYMIKWIYPVVITTCTCSSYNFERF